MVTKAAADPAKKKTAKKAAAEKKQPAKKAAAAPPAKKKKPANKNPEDEYFDRLQAFVGTVPGGVGFMITRGVDGESDESSSDEERGGGGGGREELNAEQVATLRHVILTKRRHACVERAQREVLGEQADHDFMMFGTSFSWDVLDLLHAKCAAQAKKAAKDPALAFDELLAFTAAISEHDVWVHDNEEPDELVGAVNKLGKAWAKLLAKSDAELGIDAEYTRPGVQALLEEFQETVADLGEYAERAPKKWALG